MKQWRHIDTDIGAPYSDLMEVHFSPEKEARLQEAAGRAGKDPVQMVEEAVDRMLEYDSRFLEAVEQG